MQTISKSKRLAVTTAMLIARSSHPLPRNCFSTVSATPYTIDFCPPTPPDTLREVVLKHEAALSKFLDRQPVAQNTRDAFEAIYLNVPLKNKNIILDSGCGTGRSTEQLANLYPNDFVIGVDRSLPRLEQNAKKRERVMTDNDDVLMQKITENAWTVRADLHGFWRLCTLSMDCSISHHYLLYPNPYPKAKRWKQRFYGHPSFPLMLSMSPITTVRSNWRLYLEEFATAAKILGYNCTLLDRVPEDQAWTNFEAKYWAVGEPTFELLIEKCS